MKDATKIFAMVFGSILGIGAIINAERKEKEAIKEYEQNQEVLNQALDHVKKNQ